MSMYKPIKHSALIQFFELLYLSSHTFTPANLVFLSHEDLCTFNSIFFPPFPTFFPMRPRPSGGINSTLPLYPSILPTLLISFILCFLCFYILTTKQCYKGINPIAMLICIKFMVHNIGWIPALFHQADISNTYFTFKLAITLLLSSL